MALDQVRVNRLWEAVRLTSHELVWELDPSGVIRYINDASEELLGSPPAELVGRNVLSLIHPDDVEGAREVLRTCTERRTGWRQVRTRALRADGRPLWVETSGVAHVGHEDELLGFTATTRRLDADDARAAQLLITRQRVEEVIREGLLTTVWQPIFSLYDGAMVGLEALSRFSGAEAQPPDRWFADAFDVGLGHSLETLAVRSALAIARDFPEHLYLSVNLSPETVATGELRAVVEQDIIPAERIVVELTEHVSIDNYETVAAGIGILRNAGVRLAVDDAGAGFASFRHILQLQPDMIKLDQSITRGITENPAQRALATALVLFALEVGSMTVTAEGVETSDDLSTVSSLGLDAAQGFYMARPRPASEIDWGMAIAPGWPVAAEPPRRPRPRRPASRSARPS
ncbi:MAG TPA: EAL domain-containing protein [Acidimicrobiales bacterium]|nr:EAL domain-containing protein [Acidimicrobiales bacterium]